MHKSAFASYVEATLRTHPSSEQAATGCLLRPPELIACHSGATLARAEGMADGRASGYNVTTHA